MSTSNHLALMILGPLCLLVGIAMLGSAGKRIWYFWRSRGWPSANGVITRSEVRDDADNDGYVWVAPYVEYSYEVEGRGFTANTLQFGFKTERFATPEEAQERANRFPTGSNVSVWYHPKKPSICVLERKIQRGTLPFFAGGGAIIFFGTWMLLDAIRV